MVVTAKTAAVGAVCLVVGLALGVAAPTIAVRVVEAEEETPAREVVARDAAIPAPRRTTGAQVVTALGVAMGDEGTAPAVVLVDMTPPALSTRQMSRGTTIARSPWPSNRGK